MLSKAKHDRGALSMGANKVANLISAHVVPSHLSAPAALRGRQRAAPRAVPPRSKDQVSRKLGNCLAYQVFARSSYCALGARVLGYAAVTLHEARAPSP